MNKSKTALIRRTTIFSRLNTGATLNVKELAEEFEVTIRTIQKDFNESLMTTYDVVDMGHGNYAFPEGYQLKAVEDEEEKIAVSLMKSLQRSVAPALNEYIDTALPMTRNYEEMFLFDLDFEPIEDMGMFKVILKAIQWQTGLEFIYTKKDGSSKEVTVHPHRIANFKNYWYLIAYDLMNEKIKTYYLKSISKLHTLYENFIPNESTQRELDALCSNIDTAWYSGGEEQTTLHISGDARVYLQRHLPQHIQIIDTNESYVTASISYSSETEVLEIVKRWLPDIEIVDDVELSEKLDEILRGFLDRG